MARPTIKTADLEKIQALVLRLDGIMDYRHVIAYIMRACGCTYSEIGAAFGISKQMAQHLVNIIEEEKQ